MSLKEKFKQWMDSDKPLESPILKELSDYSVMQSERLTMLKALRVWRKCIRAGKTQLADLIKTKYNLGSPSHAMRDDMVASFGMALLFAKQFKDNNEKN